MRFRKSRGVVVRLTAAVALSALIVAFGARPLVARMPGRLVRQARAAARSLEGRRARFVDDVKVDHFLRGNVHTHSRASDGAEPTEVMIHWYRDHGYRFLAMTEHNKRLDPEALAVEAAPMVLIAGEEVTNKVGGLPMHVNSLCASTTIGGDTDFAHADVGLATVIGAIRAHGGVPLVNHPNFHWALTADDIARGASGRYLLEVWSGHPDVRPGGDAGHPSEEAIWDALLARGADVAPAGVDDAHELPTSTRGGDALPGRAWVETFGDDATPAAICEALAAGRVYASNGPEITQIEVRGDTFAVAATDPGATVAFVAERGDVLLEAGANATYRLAGGESWVRARVTGPDGSHAWTPAFRVTAP